ncbi:MAG: hypothetical protein ACT4PS_13425 [Betaproteobacteria bacterium]
MAAAIPGATQAFLSVTQFAAREGVTRTRVLQLLAAGRIPGARKAGHQWVIPATARMVRRAAGRPGKASRSAADAFLRRMAGKYVWWLSPDEALQRQYLVMSQVMELGDYDDVSRLVSTLGRDALVAALRAAEPGRYSARSWTYWHYRLGLAPLGAVPPLPERVIP